MIKAYFSATMSYKWLILFSYQLNFLDEASNFLAESANLSLISSSSALSASFYPKSFKAYAANL